jgi:hypothetical protein
MRLSLYWKIAILVFVILIGALTYAVVFGKLLPYSPVAIGFEKHETEHTIIYVEKGSQFNDFQKIDKLLDPVEEFHQLKFQRKPKIYIFSNKEDYYGRTLSRARFFAYPNGDIVVAPWSITEADSGKISLEIYLTHELSHTILYQNMGILAAYHFPQWLMEGTAVYSSNQFGTSIYPSKERTYEAIKNGVYFPPEYFKTDMEDNVKIDLEYPIAFKYSEFGCIVDYLIQQYGKDKFLDYLNKLKENKNYIEAFKATYGTELDDVLTDLRRNTGQSQ